MEKETPPGKLQEVMADTAEGLVRRTAQLAGLVQEEFDGGNTSGAEVAAALGVIAEIARAGSTIFREQGGVIFEDRQGPKTQEVKVEERTLAPKTFGDLLRARIEETLPGQREQFKRAELKFLLGGRSKTAVKVIKELGLASQRKFTRNQATEIIERVLTSSLRTRGETYSRSMLGSAFLVPPEKLAEWSNTIGYDWTINPTIDKSEALAIRGLAALEKLAKESPKS